MFEKLIIFAGGVLTGVSIGIIIEQNNKIPKVNK